MRGASARAGGSPGGHDQRAGELDPEGDWQIVPRLGKAIADDEASYRYLIESIRRFPPMPEFERMIRAAGFERTRVEPIMGGLVAIHSGWKI